jgi:3-dehydroquinate dehydratase-2
MRTVLVLSGPNLNLLGQREPEIYGTDTLDDHVAAVIDELGEGWAVEHVQANHEGDLIDAIQTGRARADALIVNAAAFSHYAWGLHDALATFAGPIIEVHLSNPYARDAWRRLSVVSPVATGVVCGFRGLGYRLAARAVKELLA